MWTGCGAGLLLLNNVSQIYIAQGGDKGGADVFVTILSVGSGFGRLSSGIISDRFMSNRAYFMTLSVGAMGLSLLLCMLHSTVGLYMACTVAGLSYGALNCLNATVVSEIFGQLHFSSIYATASIALACGSFTISSFLVGQAHLCDSLHLVSPGADSSPYAHGSCRYTIPSSHQMQILCAIPSLHRESVRQR